MLSSAAYRVHSALSRQQKGTCMIPEPPLKLRSAERHSAEKRTLFPMAAGAGFAASKIAKALLQKLRQKKYRDAYVAEHVRQGIAYQIRALRDQREWNQGKLSQLLGKPQSVISRLEDPSYGKVTIQTLLEFASAFDVAVQVRFISYSSFLQQTRDLSISSMKVAAFNKDLGMSRKTHSPIFYTGVTTGLPEEQIYIPAVNGRNALSTQFLPASPPVITGAGAVYAH
jgi:predicted XRE-type DNA-binding protein